MLDDLKVGEEVSFPGLLEIRLIVEEVAELRGNVRCKYYDEHLKKFIRLTLPSDSIIRSAKGRRTPTKIQPQKSARPQPACCRAKKDS